MTKIENSLECMQKLMDMMKANGATHFSFKDKECDVDIEIGSKQTVLQSAIPDSVTSAPQNTVSAPEVPAGNIVKAPLIGTFYAGSSPDAKPFVTTGQKVSKGDVLFIIESMKVMNEVKSEFDGTVIVVNCKNGEAVEYDQPVMIIS